MNSVAQEMTGCKQMDAITYWGENINKYWWPKDINKCQDPLRKWLLNSLTANKCLMLTYSTTDYMNGSDWEKLHKKMDKFFKSKLIMPGSFWSIEFYCGKDGVWRPHSHAWIKTENKHHFRQHSKRAFGGAPALHICEYTDISNGLDYVKTPQDEDKKDNKLRDAEFRETAGLETYNYKI